MDKTAEALRFAENGMFEEACRLYEEMLTEHHDDASTLYNLGMCFTELNQPEKAIKALEQAIKHKPDHANAYVALGFAHAKLQDYEKAKNHFLTALEIEPKNAYAMRNLGGLYGKLGDNANAIFCLQKAYAIRPSDPQTIYGLGHIYEQLKDNEKADRYYKEVLKLDAPTEIKALAREGLRRIAHATFKSKGPREVRCFALQLDHCPVPQVMMPPLSHAACRETKHDPMAPVLMTVRRQNACRANLFQVTSEPGTH